MRIDILRLKSAISVPAVLESAGIAVTKRKIPCPFCASRPKDYRSPSLYVQVHRCRCYRCGKGGDIVRTTMDLFDLGFRDALRKLNGELGMVSIPDRRITAWDRCAQLNLELQKTLDEIELDWAGDWDWVGRDGEAWEDRALRVAGIRAEWERTIDREMMRFWEASWQIMENANGHP